MTVYYVLLPGPKPTVPPSKADSLQTPSFDTMNELWPLYSNKGHRYPG
jgi:hypothetical protein